MNLGKYSIGWKLLQLSDNVKTASLLSLLLFGLFAPFAETTYDWLFTAGLVIIAFAVPYFGLKN